LRVVQALEPQRCRPGPCRSFGHEPDELGAGNLDAACRCLGFDTRHDLLERRRLPVFDVHRHLDEPSAREREPERAYAAKPASRLADHRCDGLRHPKVVGCEVDVEGDERPSGADENASGARMEPMRATIGSELTCVDSPLELGRSALPKERRAHAGRQLPIEEDGQLELCADPVSKRERDAIRRVELLGPDGNDGHDVGCTHARMHALVLTEVHAVACARDRRHERVDEGALPARDRKDGAVVVGIGVDIEHVRLLRQRLTNGRDRLSGATFGEVRDGLERTSHAAYSRSVKEYYERFAPEYDAFYRGDYYEGDEHERFRAEVGRLESVLAALPPARTLDVACGTGYLTKHLPGEVVGLDSSASMLAHARAQAPRATFVYGEALELPFDDLSFDRVFTGHLYGHLEEPQRLRFLAEARRIAPELVVVDAPLRPDHSEAEWQVRRTADGAEWPLYKRFFAPTVLCAELDRARVLLDGEWFLAVVSR
jgi:SAM-dependent methyltransferase